MVAKVCLKMHGQHMMKLQKAKVVSRSVTGRVRTGAIFCIELSCDYIEIDYIIRKNFKRQNGLCNIRESINLLFISIIKINFSNFRIWVTLA